MGQIQVLDFSVANLIAAGEVVERPASAVKELLENALDAGADTVTVEIKNGGVTFLRVSDNGKGMDKDDVPIAIKRHATSKIRTAADLDGILTLGFRGEALAAIASVSHLRIMTKTADAKTGTLLEACGGEIVELCESGCPNGTTVIVEELFANVPARRKFLKKDQTEAMAVSAVVEKLALSRPDVSFRLIIDNNPKFVTAGDGKLSSAIYAILGKDFVRKLLPVDYLTEGIELTGYIGRPDNVRGNRNFENFFINGRYVKSGTASAGIEQAFRSYMPTEKFPCCVLNLRIHPALVDVNVHPTKLEVKFSNEKTVFDAVYCAVRNTLTQHMTTPEMTLEDRLQKRGEDIKNAFAPITDRLHSRLSEQMTLPLSQPETVSAESPAEPAASPAEPMPNHAQAADRQTAEPAASNPETLNQAKPATVTAEKSFLDFQDTLVIDLPNDGGIVSAPSAMPLRKGDIKPENTPKQNGKKAEPVLSTAGQSYPSKIGGESASVLLTEIEKEAQLRDSSSRQGEAASVPSQLPKNQTAGAPSKSYRMLGVAFHSYIFLESGDSVLIVDKHAAHERILFEEMKKNLHASVAAQSQMLLVPYHAVMDSTELAALEAYRSEIEAVGFQFTTDSGRHTVAVDAIPFGLEDHAPYELFMTIASQLQSGTGDAGVARDAAFEAALFQASCKAAVKAGRIDTPEAMTWICSKLSEYPDIRFCPHGRPVMFELTKHEIEKQFRRI